MSAKKNVGRDAVRRARRLSLSVGRKERATATQRARTKSRSATRKARRPQVLLKGNFLQLHFRKILIQRSAKRFVNLAKQDPGRARQNK